MERKSYDKNNHRDRRDRSRNREREKDRDRDRGKNNKEDDKKTFDRKTRGDKNRRK